MSINNLINNSIQTMSSRAACLIVSIVFLLSNFIFYPVVFEQNDDVIMKLIANGYFTGQAESHLVFINIIAGSILKFLYTYIPRIEWYAVMQIGLIITVFFSNLYCIIKYETNAKRLILTLINLSLIYFLSRLQFSYVSGFLAISAVISQFYGLTNDNKKLLAFSVVLMLLSSLIRFEMFFFTYPILFITFLFKIKKVLSVKVAVIGGVLIIGAFLINQFSYKNNPDWKNYQDYNKARGTVTNNLNLNLDDKNLIQTLKLNDEDRFLLSNYIFTENLTTEKLKKLASYSKESHVSIEKSVVSIYSYVTAYSIVIIAFLLVSLITRRFTVAIAILLHIIMILITVRFSNMVQYRILYPTLFCLLFLYLQSLKTDESKSLSVFLTASLSIFVLIQVRDIKKNTFFNIRAQNNIREIEMQLPKNKAYLVDPTSNYFLIGRSAFENPERKFVFFGWLTNFPTNKKTYPDYNSNLYRMAEHPLIISNMNYNKLKSFIFNKTIYTIQEKNIVVPTVKTQ
ncbi:hypothetical protein [Chryseobacterium sp. SIMBA_038]|uniref:hypothetical protein n=1 Tax=Chryseobacterium sp. SIMBA_038 TaxID=3085780 RepID=UPI00397B6FEF